MKRIMAASYRMMPHCEAESGGVSCQASYLDEQRRCVRRPVQDDGADGAERQCEDGTGNRRPPRSDADKKQADSGQRPPPFDIAKYKLGIA